MSDITSKKRTRGGGGAARRASRTSISFDTAKFIERKIPLFEILNEESLELIEANAELMLEEVGVAFVNNPKALELWKNAGADVDGERVHVPKGLARQLIKTAPSSFVQHARNPDRSVEIDRKSVV